MLDHPIVFAFHPSVVASLLIFRIKKVSKSSGQMKVVPSAMVSLLVVPLSLPLLVFPPRPWVLIHHDGPLLLPQLPAPPLFLIFLIQTAAPGDVDGAAPPHLIPRPDRPQVLPLDRAPAPALGDIRPLLRPLALPHRLDRLHNDGPRARPDLETLVNRLEQALNRLAAGRDGDLVEVAALLAVDAAEGLAGLGVDVLADVAGVGVAAVAERGVLEVGAVRVGALAAAGAVRGEVLHDVALVVARDAADDVFTEADAAGHLLFGGGGAGGGDVGVVVVN